MMLRVITSALTAVALAGTVSVLAQERQDPAAPRPANPPSSAQEANQRAEKATLTGCVMEAKTTDGSTAFVLNKAEGGSAAMYVLVASTPSELSSHVNKRVEVTGPVQQPSSPPDADGKVLRPPLVRVESVKDVEGTCK
jgi:hypothetical protein